MNSSNVKNIRAIRAYRDYLLEAKGLNEKSVLKMERAIHLYRDFTNDEDFKNYNSERAIDFKKFLRRKKHRDKPIATNSYRTYLIHLKGFFVWLCTQDGYKSCIKFNSLEYLTVNKKESRLASQTTIRSFPLIEYIKSLADSVDATNEIGLRDRALISFTFLTGMRDSAIISLSIESLNEVELYVEQNPKFGVNTKFGKTSYSKIFKFDQTLLDYILEWIKYIKKKGFKNTDPLFPRAKMKKEGNDLSYQIATEVEPLYWENTESMRKIFKDQCKKAKLEYYSPHTFRHSAIYYALKSVTTAEQLKALSQNFSHENIMMMLSVYGQLTPEHQLNILNQLDFQDENGISDEELKKLLKRILNKKRPPFK